MNFSASATHCSFSNLCSLHFGGISEGAQMYLDGMWVLRFLSNPVQIGGDDVKRAAHLTGSQTMAVGEQKDRFVPSVRCESIRTGE
jgi:hypothetical protein